MAITRLTLPSLDSLAAKYCDDVRRIKLRNGVATPNVAKGSETATKAEAVASATLNIMAREIALQDATMPDSASWDDLVRWAKVWKNIDPSTGAGAMGYVKVTTTGSVTFPVGRECTTDDGLTYQVLATTTATSGGYVPIAGVDVGKKTNKPLGTVVTWSSPPSGSDATAVVALGGLVNGTDPDNTERLRQRTLDAVRHPQQAGNWAHYVKWAEEASAAVEKAFCYPAVQGPSTVHLAFTVTGTEETAWSRAPDSTLVNQVAQYVVMQDPEHADVLVTGVAETSTNVVLHAILPYCSADSGPGGGWIDEKTTSSATDTRWPRAETAPNFVKLAAAPTAPNTIRVDVVSTSNTPVVNSHIAIWSSTERKFVHTRVASYTSVTTTQFDVVLYDPIDPSLFLSGDAVCPDCEHLDDYATTMIAQFATLGPGEKTSTAALLPRSYRRPLPAESWPSMLTSANIGALTVAHPEMQQVTVATPALPCYPSVASPVTSSPNILNLGQFAIYPLAGY